MQAELTNTTLGRTRRSDGLWVHPTNSLAGIDSGNKRIQDFLVREVGMNAFSSRDPRRLLSVYDVTLLKGYSAHYRVLSQNTWNDSSPLNWIRQVNDREFLKFGNELFEKQITGFRCVLSVSLNKGGFIYKWEALKSGDIKPSAAEQYLHEWCLSRRTSGK